MVREVHVSWECGHAWDLFRAGERLFDGEDDLPERESTAKRVKPSGRRRAKRDRHDVGRNPKRDEGFSAEFGSDSPRRGCSEPATRESKTNPQSSVNGRGGKGVGGSGSKRSAPRGGER